MVWHSVITRLRREEIQVSVIAESVEQAEVGVLSQTSCKYFTVIKVSLICSSFLSKRVTDMELLR